MRVRILLSLLAVLALAASAAAATSGTVTISLSPNKAGKASKLSVSATGPFTFTGLPKSAEFTVQKGFKASAKSVARLCSSSQASAGACPAASQIGSGSAQGSGSYGVIQEQDTITFSLFLGVRQQPGDIASVVIEGTDSLFKSNLHTVGRLFQSGGGLELLFDQFPTISNIPAGTSVTLNSLSLSAGAKHSVKKGRRKHRHKVHYSLITNPKTCSGQWTGTFTLTFASGNYTKALSAACTK